MTSTTTREPVVYESGGLRIFGVIHRGAGPAGVAQPGVVMYHGFVAAKYQPPHRLFVQLAEALARRGIVSLRIDLPGRGDSEGESVDITVEADLLAGQQALDVLAAQPNVDATRLGLVGISWGGVLAATLASRDQRVAATALWSSVPSEWVRWQPDFQELEGRRVVEFVGNLIGEQFYAGLRQLQPLKELQRTRGSVLLVYGTQDDQISSAEIEHARQQLSAASVPHQVVPIDGADHVFFAPAWQRQVVETTTTWLQQALQAGTEERGR